MDALKLSLSANNGDRAQQLRTDQWGGQLALTFGRQRNDDALDTGPRRAGDYIKFTAAGFGSLALNPQGDFFVTGRANTQYGNRNLDASEQLGIGGPNAVRGYRIDEPSLNDGAVFNFGLYKRFPVAEGHQVQVGPILDFAYGRVNHTPWTGWERSYPGIDVKNTRRLASYGLEAAWLTPIGVTLTVSASKAFGFSDTSWVRAGKKPTQYWMTASWNH
jgi:hemolysin activation/secretion protein